MIIVIDHDACKHGGAFADRCLMATLLHPLGHERSCLAEVVDDGRPELTVTLRFDGEEHRLVLKDPQEVRAVALEGWTAFVRQAA